MLINIRKILFNDLIAILLTAGSCACDIDRNDVYDKNLRSSKMKVSDLVNLLDLKSSAPGSNIREVVFRAKSLGYIIERTDDNSSSNCGAERTDDNDAYMLYIPSKTSGKISYRNLKIFSDNRGVIECVEEIFHYKSP